MHSYNIPYTIIFYHFFFLTMTSTTSNQDPQNTTPVASTPATTTPVASTSGDWKDATTPATASIVESTPATSTSGDWKDATTPATAGTATTTPAATTPATSTSGDWKDATTPATNKPEEPKSIFGSIGQSISSGFHKIWSVVVAPLSRWSSTPENLPTKLDILDSKGEIDPSKLAGVEKIKFGPDIDAISCIHQKSWKHYVILPNPRRMLPLKGAYKIIWHVKIFWQDYLEYENSYLIPTNQRCMCDIHGEIFVSNYKYIDSKSIVVNGEECIKVAYDYWDTVREVFALINKTGRRIAGFSFAVEKIIWLLPVLAIEKTNTDEVKYFYESNDKLTERNQSIDQTRYKGTIKEMLIFEIFAKKYTLWEDGDRILISESALVQDMLVNSKKVTLLQNI